jgi:hypothetical protein
MPQRSARLATVYGRVSAGSIVSKRCVLSTPTVSGWFDVGRRVHARLPMWTGTIVPTGRLLPIAAVSVRRAGDAIVSNWRFVPDGTGVPEWCVLSGVSNRTTAVGTMPDRMSNRICVCGRIVLTSIHLQISVAEYWLLSVAADAGARTHTDMSDNPAAGVPVRSAVGVSSAVHVQFGHLLYPRCGCNDCATTEYACSHVGDRRGAAGLRLRGTVTVQRLQRRLCIMCAEHVRVHKSGMVKRCELPADCDANNVRCASIVLTDRRTV